MKTRITLITLSLILFLSCSKDSSSPSYPLSATIDGVSFNISEVEMGYAKSNGSLQINAVKIGDRNGFQFFLGTDAKAGTYDLATSLVSIVYTTDPLTSQYYKLQKGEYTINSVSYDPIALDATFSGWAYKTTNPSDSIEIKEGIVNITFE